MEMYEKEYRYEGSDYIVRMQKSLSDKDYSVNIQLYDLKCGYPNIPSNIGSAHENFLCHAETSLISDIKDHEFLAFIEKNLKQFKIDYDIARKIMKKGV